MGAAGFANDSDGTPVRRTPTLTLSTTKVGLSRCRSNAHMFGRTAPFIIINLLDKRYIISNKVI